MLLKSSFLRRIVVHLCEVDEGLFVNNDANEVPKTARETYTFTRRHMEHTLHIANEVGCHR